MYAPAQGNATTESPAATTKTESTHRSRFKMQGDALFAVVGCIEGFNDPVRRHSKLGFHSTHESERMTLAEQKVTHAVDLRLLGAQEPHAQPDTRKA
jgi:hypothetical protein